jgi:hypothetical protein
MALAQLHSRKNQSIGILVRERLQQHRMGYAEDCGTRPNAERNRNNCCQGEERTSPQNASRDFPIL